jgi:5-methylthioadenosine/S-adenosylhomocysteine deaminase
MPNSCDLLLTRATILVMDDAFTLVRDGAVAVRADAIVAVGPTERLALDWEPRQTVDCGGKVLLPGLINAHTHAAMTLMRGLADDLRLDVWLQGYMMPVEREFVNPDFVQLGTRLACAEMIRSGVTCFADMYYYEDAVAEATAAAGLRALCAQTVLKFPSPDASSYEDALALTRDFIQKWKNHPLIVPSPAPHAPYTCTPDILQACAALAVEFDVPLHTHLAETALEVENSRKEHGMPVVPWVRKQTLFDAKVLAAHCVHVDEGEIRTLQRYGAGVAHNPTSNLKLASGVAPVTKMLELGIKVGIGTDGPASNNDLDMFEEIHLAAILAKNASNDPTAVPARQALAMATRLGAEAMHMGHLIGSLEPGKRADLILVDLNPLHNAPAFSRDANGVYAQLVYAAKSTDVTDVLCNGQWLMRDRQLLTLDEAALREAAAVYAQKIDAFLTAREGSVLQKLIAIGGAVEEESFEVQVKARSVSPETVLATLKSEAITMIRARHYHEFDTYFGFDDPKQGRLRYREDEFLNEKGQVTQVRSRLTLTGPSREAAFEGVPLSRSRYFAPATHSLRFYREYFRPSTELEIEKDRRRWLVAYRGVEFYVNLDQLIKPHTEGHYLEIKARTWSRRDAQDKAAMIAELLKVFGASPDSTTADYVELAQR